MKKNKALLAGFAVLLILIAVFSALYFGLRQKGEAGNKTISVTVIHKDLSQKEFELQTDAAYLGEALSAEGLIAGTEGEFGLYVTEVDNETADEGNQEWWCFTQNGESVMTGVDLTPIEEGSHFEITLTTGW